MYRLYGFIPHAHHFLREKAEAFDVFKRARPMQYYTKYYV